MNEVEKFVSVEWINYMNLQKTIRNNLPPGFPEVVTLCGSTRFMDAYITEQRRLTLEGKIVISVGLFGHQEGLDMDSDTKIMLDKLHLRKIDYSDRIHVINVGGYIGSSTRNEIEYAQANGKVITYLEPIS